jgi:hypothetical protein
MVNGLFACIDQKRSLQYDKKVWPRVQSEELNEYDRDGTPGKDKAEKAILEPTNLNYFSEEWKVRRMRFRQMPFVRLMTELYEAVLDGERTGEVRCEMTHSRKVSQQLTIADRAVEITDISIWIRVRGVECPALVSFTGLQHSTTACAVGPSTS